MFKNLAKEKEFVDKEVELYRKEQMLAIDSEMVNQRKRVVDLAVTAAIDVGNHEHEYHSKMEKLGINIAKLEAQAETMENDVNTYKMLIKEKDKEIERMVKIVDAISKNPTTVKL